MREHFHNLQALRGTACIMVVLGHLWSCEKQFGVQTPLFREIQWFGFAGVDLFFVLSGFLITSTNRKHLGRPADVPGYLFRRFWRIYPMFWVSMAVAAATILVVFGNGAFTPDVSARWPRWIALAPMSHTESNLFIGQAWTLTYEVMFYLAFAAIMFVPPRLGAVLLCGWAAVIFASLTGAEPTGPLAIHVLSPFVFEFLGGCAIAALVAHGPLRGGRFALALGLTYVFAAMFLTHALMTQSWPDEMAGTRTRVLVFGPPAVLFVYGMVALEARRSRLAPRWLMRVGDASYSLYLLHSTVLGVGMYVGYKVPHSRLPHLLWLAGTFVACLAVGLLAYRYIEKPLLNLAKRTKAKPAPLSNTNTCEAPAKLAA